MKQFHSRLISAAADGALVLTANKRLARHLRAGYDRQMQQRGQSVWHTPQILSLDAWLHRCLTELGESWRLLDGPAALHLWERLIEEASAGSELELLQIPATARKAQEAHHLLTEYCCDLKGLPLTEDQQVFSQWRQRYLDSCKREGWLDRVGMPALVCQALNDGRLPLPGEVLVAGFDQWSPSLDKLKTTVESGGGRLQEVLPQPPEPAATLRTICPDPQQEVVQAARWARRLLEEGATSIGVVVPDLKSRRAEIERVFREQIDPSAALMAGSEEAAFSLSLGAPLAEQGSIHAALQLLSAGHTLTLDQASFLLRTPFLGGSGTEADRRALLDKKLRSFRQSAIGLKRLSELAAKDDSAPLAAEIFKRLLQSLGDRTRRLPGEWAGRFATLLQEAGWPGQKALSSNEFQAVKAWHDKLLPALASLDAVAHAVDLRKALGLLRRLALEQEFQVEAPSGPVQVVGLLESAGLDFDHLWVMGLTEEALPAPPRPNPFIPMPLQLQRQMPHASADRELLFARKVLCRLKAASADLIFSSPKRQGDCELRPSPLIADLATVEVRLAEPQDPLHRFLSLAPVLDSEEDDQGPRLTDEVGQGGTGILKDQALCPFRAFAHYRLFARGFDQAQPGLDAMTRGDLLHKSLECFWRRVGSSQQLLAMDENELAGVIESQIDTALDEYFGDQVRPEPRLLQLEKKRLVALVDEWVVQVERDRPPFTVEEIEQEHTETLGPLKIKTVIDRIDRLADGSRIILDYKTGSQVKVDGLLGERLLEPQLPIYAVGDKGAEADGVAFARVRRGECRMVGIAREEGLMTKVAGVGENKLAQELGVENWQQLLTHWRQQLEATASDFVAGQAAVDPVDTEQACRFCDLTGLCRINEADSQEVTS